MLYQNMGFQGRRIFFQLIFRSKHSDQRAGDFVKTSGCNLNLELREKHSNNSYSYKMSR